MLDAILHLLEKGGWVADDAQVKDVVWRTLDLDRKNPGAQVTAWRKG